MELCGKNSSSEKEICFKYRYHHAHANYINVGLFMFLLLKFFTLKVFFCFFLYIFLRIFWEVPCSLPCSVHPLLAVFSSCNLEHLMQLCKRLIFSFVSIKGIFQKAFSTTKIWKLNFVPNNEPSMNNFNFREENNLLYLSFMMSMKMYKVGPDTNGAKQNATVVKKASRKCFCLWFVL